MKKLAETNPDYKDVLLKKAEIQEKKHLTVTNKDEYIKILEQVDDVLTKVESELSLHIGGELSI